MSSSTLLKLTCAVVMGMVVLAPYAEAAVTCGTVNGNLAPCLGYLEGMPGPNTACCSGIMALKNAATSVADKKTVCNCLKNAANALKGAIDISKAAGLPSKCGVSIPYAIRPNTNCNAYVSIRH